MALVARHVQYYNEDRLDAGSAGSLLRRQTRDVMVTLNQDGCRFTRIGLERQEPT